MARVLIIDDEKDLAEMCALVLEWEGHTALRWRPGEPILAAIRRAQPDVVLLDWVLGDVNGDRVLAAIKGLPHPPRVVVTSALHDVEALARSLGASAFVGKPFKPERLLRAVGTLAPPSLHA